jgi:UDP-2,3-diacylglucosamine hydrolase
MSSLFISDLHLEPGRADISGQFLEFMSTQAREADALYILGDLFEVWLGDDDPTPFSAEIKSAIRGVVDAGVPVSVMHGNRDFMLGEGFCTDTGVTLMDEYTVAELYGTRVLVMHGDLLCTDDVEYQQFRRMVRDPQWQQQMLAMPFPMRVNAARKMREQTKAATQLKAAEIMDVNQQTVEATMREYGVHTLLHGHTHRPAVHEFTLDGGKATRIVLGDWFDQGSVLRWDASGVDLQGLPR